MYNDRGTVSWRSFFEVARFDQVLKTRNALPGISLAMGVAHFMIYLDML